MPYRRSEVYTTTGTKQSWNTDASIAPFTCAIAFTLSAGTVDYKLQYTLDPLDSPTSQDNDASWFDSVDIPPGTTGNSVASFLTPVARVRVVIAALSGGSLKMEMIQGLSVN